MSQWGIRKKVLLLALLPGALIGLMLYSYFVSNQVHLLERALNDRGTTIAQEVAPASEYGVVTGNRAFLQRLLAAVLNDHEVIGVAIRDRTGKALVATGALKSPSRIAALPRPAAGVEVCGHQPLATMFCAPIRQTRLQVNDYPTGQMHGGDSAPRAIGWVYVELTRQPMIAQRNAAILQALLITLTVLGITWVLAVRLGSEISGPILRLTRTVERARDGDLEVRAPVDASGEIQTLQSGVNAMIEAMAAAHEDLQWRVEEATEQLRRALGELRGQNRNLELQRVRAQEASLAKSRFLATMSHEIRTPISGIVGMLALVRQTPLEPAQREYLDNVELATRALRTLIDDILDLSRIEAGKLVLNAQPCDPGAVAEEVAVMLAPAAHEKRIELVCRIATDFPVGIETDPVRLRQVLTNLTANAIKFTEQGEVVIHATVAAAGAGAARRVRFEVRDTGIGIAAEKQAEIFDSFTQADSSTARRYGGSGLGTTIAKQLVELMGGTIGLHSTPGRGSTFWFELPLGQGVVVEPLPAQERSALVVDGHLAGREALREHCARLGIRAETVDSPAAAMEWLAQAHRRGQMPAVVLLMESRHHGDLTGLARTIGERFGAIPLCHGTFFGNTSDPALFRGHLRKPVTRELLRRCLERLEQPARDGEPSEADGAKGVARRVLLAEDDRINATVIINFLERAGHRVELVPNGEEALRALERERYDVVLMDMRMPGMDGLEATRRWRRQEPEAQHLPIIALTANATVEDRALCLAAGMDDFLSKPVAQEQLSEMVARVSGDRFAT